jgi:heme-degrading monooxygenase HmoA
MIVTVFRSRLKPEAMEEYGPMAQRMSELVQTIPGYISHKGFVADDGERVTIVEFETEEAVREWATHLEHVKAKKRGIEAFYSEYKIQVCNTLRERSWQATSNELDL